MENSKYKNSKVYKIVDNTENQFYYIGSTITTLARRFYKHKRDGTTHPNQKIYKYFNSINWDAGIVLIKELCLENKNQLRREEDNILKDCLNDPKCLNMRRQLTIHEEKIEQHKEYYKKNKDWMLELTRAYYHEHKEENKQKRKQYNIEHREHKAEYDKEYREKNKEKLIEKRSAVFVCECGSTSTVVHKMRHIRTKNTRLMHPYTIV